jgi:hypothetical protein
MTLGPTQPLTEMSIRNIVTGKGQQERKAANLTANCEPIVHKMWDTRCLVTLQDSLSCYAEGHNLNSCPYKVICLSTIQVSFKFVFLSLGVASCCGSIQLVLYDAVNRNKVSIH